MTTNTNPGPVRMRDLPGHSIALSCDVDAVDAADAADATQLGTADVALTALFGLYAAAGEVPLTLELSTAYLDGEFGVPLDSPARPDADWALHSEGLPPELRIRPRAKDQKVRRAPAVDPNGCRTFVADALRRTDRDMSQWPVGWRTMEVHACAVRLPTDVPLDDGTLPVQVGRGIVRHRVEIHEGARWAAGPTSPSMIQAPLECWISQEHGELDLNVSVLWTPWCPGGSAYPPLRRSVETLVGDGWELASEG
ncbi:hypothetical protein GTY65_05240 [Streptomyces sp. SID8379]|uniref:hypothetical protein n=1 Tax=unclassified Streptomyces TaxID=2593676 RepID=UPI00039C4167|nr:MULTISPECIES: hypothetical protein [unclassified Streptomyces]MYW63484.1 hypothetical protein [Streptomyces sp. SID8379]